MAAKDTETHQHTTTWERASMLQGTPSSGKRRGGTGVSECV